MREENKLCTRISNFPFHKARSRHNILYVNVDPLVFYIYLINMYSSIDNQYKIEIYYYEQLRANEFHRHVIYGLQNKTETNNWDNVALAH